MRILDAGLLYLGALQTSFPVSILHLTCFFPNRISRVLDPALLFSHADGVACVSPRKPQNLGDPGEPFLSVFSLSNEYIALGRTSPWAHSNQDTTSFFYLSEAITGQ